MENILQGAGYNWNRGRSGRANEPGDEYKEMLLNGRHHNFNYFSTRPAKNASFRANKNLANLTDNPVNMQKQQPINVTRKSYYGV